MLDNSMCVRCHLDGVENSFAAAFQIRKMIGCKNVLSSMSEQMQQLENEMRFFEPNAPIILGWIYCRVRAYNVCLPECFSLNII